MKRFLGFRLGSHMLPVALGCRFGVPCRERVCQHCNQGVVEDELHLVWECSHLQPLRLQFGHPFGPTVTSMQAFFRQEFDVVNFVLQALSLLT